MEIDSKPEEMDRLERRIMQLKIEREALKKETDDASRRSASRRSRRTGGAGEAVRADLRRVWKAEKAALQARAPRSRKRSSARARARDGAARRRPGAHVGAAVRRIPELEKQLEDASRRRGADMTLLRNK